jgi:hypothetical protein
VSLHLIKLCVGPGSLDELRAWQARRIAQGQPLVVHTRQTPKRAAEIVDGGSLFWVIKGLVAARQRVLAIDTLGEGGQRRCEILLEAIVTPTAPQPRRAFQGWRYFDAKDAPADLASGEGGEAMPQELALRLREIGAW